MKHPSILISFAFILMLMISCNSNQDAPKTKNYSDERSDSVLNNHIKAFMDNDINAIMADYKDDAMLFAPDTVYIGKERIKSFFEGAFQLFPKDSINIILDKKFTIGNTVYLTWHGGSNKVDVSFGTDTFVIEDDKILLQTLGSVMKPKE